MIHLEISRGLVWLDSLLPMPSGRVHISMITHCAFCSHDFIVQNLVFCNSSREPGTKHLSIDIATVMSDWSISILVIYFITYLYDYTINLNKIICHIWLYSLNMSCLLWMTFHPLNKFKNEQKKSLVSIHVYGSCRLSSQSFNGRMMLCQ